MATTRAEPIDPLYSVDEYEGEQRPTRDQLAAILVVVLRYRWWMVLGAMTLALLVVASKLRTPRTYTTVSRFTSEGSSGRMSDLSGLAAQFGVQLGGDRSTYNPQFYTDFVRSPAILRPAVEHVFTFPVEGGTRTASLVQYYEIEGEAPDRARELAVRELTENVRADHFVKTGVVELAVTTRNPGLSALVNQHLLDLLDRFNTQTRRSRASIERNFIEDRIKTVSAEVRAAEDRYADFLRGNREWERSPELRNRHDQLASAAQLSRQVHMSLAQQLEQAKVDEIRNTPVLTVIQAPVAPVWPNARGTARAGLLALFLGALAGLGLGLAREQWRRRAQSTIPETRELRSLLRETWLDIRTVLTLGIWRRKHS